jgi:LPS-assembly lipoprotein
VIGRLKQGSGLAMRAVMSVALAAGVLLSLGGCGFRPLYAPVESGSGLSQIAVGAIDGKSGHVLRAQLDRLLSAGRDRGAPAAYTLTVTVEERLEPLGLRIDASATRTDLTLTANYVLTDTAGAAAFKGEIATTVGYDVPVSAFGEVSAQNDARERAGETMAELLRAELAARLAPRR